MVKDYKRSSKIISAVVEISFLEGGIWDYRPGRHFCSARHSAG